MSGCTAQKRSGNLILKSLVHVGAILLLAGLAAIFVTRPFVTLARAAFLASPAAQPVAARSLTNAERVACHYAIEEVFWHYRLWPSGNQTPKPEVASVLSLESVQSRVADTTRYSNLLAAHWNAPITGAMLQAEMDRMASETREPDQLRAIFAALDNDPILIAECLARPALAERLARDWYASDERVHGALETRASGDLAQVTSPDDLRETSGDYQETTWVRGDANSAEPTGAMVLEEADWTGERERLARYFDATPETIPTGKVSPLQEDETGFFALAVLAQNDSEMRVATARWNKQTFEEWAASAAADYAILDRHDTAVNPLPLTLYTLPGVNPVPVSPDSSPDGAPAWLPTPSLPYPNTRAIWTGAEMITFGGGFLGGGISNSGWRYNPATDTWLTISSVNAPRRRYAHSLVWTGSEMIAWGGCGPVQFSLCELGSGARYNPVTGVWVETSTTNAPDPRMRHTAVWTGAEMLVWGGHDVPNGTVSTGRVYTPATRAWRFMPDSGLPGRENLTAIWTGNEMIVWGGRSGNWSTNSGGRFNPVTNAWSPTSLADAPSGRGYPVSVWTGSEMIVWGGVGDTGIVNSGGRYDPATDSWTSTSLTSAPDGRYLFDAVWDGDEMIVWGGIGETGDLNSGGRYAPATDSWLPTNLTNAPTARHWHTAIWTGDELIVWGGVDFDTETNFSSGGRYDPGSDSWQATSLTNAPDGRVRHTAVWTGSEMIVWGGCGGLYCVSGDTFYTGGHYDPLTDNWSPTVIDAGIPRARGEHTSVWTGNSMIVWGGYTDQGGYTNTGSEYFVPAGPPPPTATATPTAGTATVTSTGVPPSSTPTGVPPTATALPGTATSVPPSSTPTGTPPATPSATGIPPQVTPSATGSIPTATATPGNIPEALRLFLPLVEG